MASTSDRDPGTRIESEVNFRPQSGPSTAVRHMRYDGTGGKFSQSDARTAAPGAEYDPRHATGRVFLDKFIGADVDVPDNMTMLTHDVTLGLGVVINLGVDSTLLVL